MLDMDAYLRRLMHLLDLFVVLLGETNGRLLRGGNGPITNGVHVRDQPFGALVAGRLLGSPRALAAMQRESENGAPHFILLCQEMLDVCFVHGSEPLVTAYKQEVSAVLDTQHSEAETLLRRHYAIRRLERDVCGFMPRLTPLERTLSLFLFFFSPFFFCLFCYVAIEFTRSVFSSLYDFRRAPLVFWFGTRRQAASTLTRARSETRSSTL